MPKKKVKKLDPIVITPPSQAIDVMTNEEKIAALTVLMHSPGWQLIAQVIDENRLMLQEAIIEGVDPETGAKLSKEEEEITRYKIKLSKEIVKTPQGYIDALRRATENTKPNFDPYYTSADMEQPERTP